MRATIVYRVRGCVGCCTDTFDIADTSVETISSTVDSFIKELLGERACLGQILTVVSEEKVDEDVCSVGV